MIFYVNNDEEAHKPLSILYDQKSRNELIKDLLVYQDPYIAPFVYSMVFLTEIFDGMKKILMGFGVEE